MGYRSDVTIIAYPSKRHTGKFAALKLFVDENLPYEFEVIGEGDRRYLQCNLYSIKWYEGYDEVQQYNKAFSEWDGMFTDPDPDPTQDHESMFHYEFIRIGEAYEDVEYECSYGADQALNMSREVYIDF